jgi:hypothetical protein
MSIESYFDDQWNECWMKIVEFYADLFYRATIRDESQLIETHFEAGEVLNNE